MGSKQCHQAFQNKILNFFKSKSYKKIKKKTIFCNKARRRIKSKDNIYFLYQEALNRTFYSSFLTAKLITFDNSQHENTNSKGDIVLKNI